MVQASSVVHFDIEASMDMKLYFLRAQQKISSLHCLRRHHRLNVRTRTRFWSIMNNITVLARALRLIRPDTIAEHFIPFRTITTCSPALCCCGHLMSTSAIIQQQHHQDIPAGPSIRRHRFKTNEQYATHGCASSFGIRRFVCCQIWRFPSVAFWHS